MHEVIRPMSKYTDFQILKGDALKIAAQYEGREAYEMAYISIWLVLEKGLHLYADEGVRLNLKDRVSDWSKFLAGEKRKAPTPIRDFSTRYTSRSIPQVALVEKSLGKMPKVARVMDPKAKWRRRRNSIAHEALPFGMATTYREYKHDLLQAIDQLQRNAASLN